MYLGHVKVTSSAITVIVYLVGHLYSKRYIELFFTSRRNTTFLSKVGEMGVGETGVGEQGISRSGNETTTGLPLPDPGGTQCSA